jgi:hypothetical protein
MRPEPGEKLVYEFGWKGVPAARLSISLTRDSTDGADRLEFEYEFRTTPTLDTIWQLEAHGRTRMDPVTLRPESAVAVSRGPRKTREVSTRFDWQQGVAEVRIRTDRKGKTKRKSETLEVGLDIPSAMTLLRTAEVPTDGTLAARVLHRDNAYSVEATPVGTGVAKVAAGSFQATEYDLTIRELTDEEDNDDAEPKYRTIRLWVAEGSRIPVKLESEVFVGHVYGELVWFQAGPIP